ncbi:Radical SAM domain protein [[Leptolyngbya] sp. PCC 7376]|uniref:7-carboxy-7-deazaguanine synthase QueE n=1 Tax=[Leptolyngbya] sp. PCC 7376 TaxID=111781 RepID=UPI00029F4DF9|nr:7-carboxy-7-deazaguanine synthase QueE [[Leptolyngbya] sp. PCC 7376]AFY39457.1 Radical SAM domain protein [[Leptolyngbya] sp. PCC 7376]
MATVATNVVFSPVLVSPTDSLHTKTYPIVETFHSLQGEGVWCGVSAFFIRLAGCDVGCPWCDTKISWSAKHHHQVAIATLTEQVKKAMPRIIVITGGEPLMHDLKPLTDALKSLDIPLHIETSGSHPLSGEFDWITLSPKTFKQPLPEIYAFVNELKVVIDNEADFDWAESEANKINPTIPKYLQPQWENSDSKDLIFQYILKHPDWRLGLQTHKFLGVQ